MPKLRLNDEYAMEQKGTGYHVFAYFEDEGEIHKDLYAGSVTLDETAMAALADFFCGNVGGGCDFLKDTQKERDEARAELLAQKKMNEFNHPV